ncbi:conserved hypothetical protein [Ricinus communis]|uniref:Uncharacterized protein n=1 Tax=Ricinus communis TaxID=3988 RepID=B9THR3_RICCO|nr:conserved hypothetical protein [Ricinus communis]
MARPSVMRSRRTKNQAIDVRIQRQRPVVALRRVAVGVAGQQRVLDLQHQARLQRRRRALVDAGRVHREAKAARSQRGQQHVGAVRAGDLAVAVEAQPHRRLRQMAAMQVDMRPGAVIHIGQVDQHLQVQPVLGIAVKRLQRAVGARHRERPAQPQRGNGRLAAHVARGQPQQGLAVGQRKDVRTGNHIGQCIIGHAHLGRALGQPEAGALTVAVSQQLVAEPVADVVALRAIEQIAERRVAAAAQIVQGCLLGGRGRVQLLAGALPQAHRAAQRAHHEPPQRGIGHDALAVIQQALERGKTAAGFQLRIFHRTFLPGSP